ncbi:MAG TPA: NUDIX domain-containing protein, partial [Polyangia bacterium]
MSVPAKRTPERRRLLVVAAYIERRGRVLLSQRRADQAFGLCWEFPGGKVEPGEDLDAALVREIREELGCTIRVNEILDLVFHAYPDFDLIMPVYRARIVAGSPRAEPIRGVDAYFWIKPPGESDGVSDPTQPRYDGMCANRDAAP